MAALPSVPNPFRSKEAHGGGAESSRTWLSSATVHPSLPSLTLPREMAPSRSRDAALGSKSPLRSHLFPSLLPALLLTCTTSVCGPSSPPPLHTRG